VPKAATKPNTNSGALREIGGIALPILGALLFLSLATYDPKDVSLLHRPPNHPPHNFVGVVGAWLACGLYFLFGVAAYLMPVLCVGFGWASWVARETKLGIKTVWAALLVLSGACLLETSIMAATVGMLRDKYELSFLGGFFGNLFVGLFSIFGKGEYIVFFLVYLCSLVLLLGAKPGAIIVAVVDQFKQRRLAAKTAKESLDDHLDEREKELTRKARQLEEEVDRKKKELVEKREIPALLQASMPKDPKIEDRSVPSVEPSRKKSKPLPVEDEIVVRAAEIAVQFDKKEADKPKPEKKEKEKPKPEIVPAVTTAEALGLVNPKPPQDDIARVDAKHDAKHRATPVPAAPPPKPPPDWSKYKLPPIDLLDFPPIKERKSDVKEDLTLNRQILEMTMREFGLDVQMGDVTKGPTITRYEVHPAPGVKVEKITALSNNIALSMKAHSVRIIPTIAGKGCIGIEVPNQSSTVVYLRDVMETSEWKSHKATIPLALGKDVSGNPIIADLTQMPHLLVAGATGSGKTVCINAIIACLLHHASPAQLRFLMIDPKIVEMQVYNGLPHLLVPVVTDTKKVILALRHVINTMEQRYQMFAKVGVRNIAAFNSRKRPAASKTAPPADDGQPKLIEVPRDDEWVIPDKLPYIVVIVDELADLMMTAPADVENAIARLAQLSRAVGIHMILATQRPSVDVVTGVIKANFPARIAFQMASKVDSRTILDGNGAEKLLGKGDMLYLPPGSSKCIRAQGVFIQDEEIKRTVEHIKGQTEPYYEVAIHEKLQKETVTPGDLAEEEDEELVEQAIEVLRTEQRASVSLLQRRMRIGYTRAARIMDLLEERGIVGPNKGAEPRDILMDLDGQIK
jgi:S-DNA-T family DNA segregation ATPase FtsK/SpoIIIE